MKDSLPFTGKNVDAFIKSLTLGTRLTCIANSYKPTNAGITATVKKPGRTSLCLVDSEGATTWIYPPKRVSDVLELTDDTITYRIGRDEHTATWRVIR